MARPKFGAFARPLQSEVEATTPATAPGLGKPGKQTRPAPYSALRGRVSAAPGEDEDAPPVLEPPVDAADKAVPPQIPTHPVETATESLAVESPPPAVPIVAPVASEPAVQEVPAPSGPAQQPPTVQLPPAKTPARMALSGPNETAVGQDLTLAVQVGGIDRLYSAPLFVNFDPALLEFVEAKEGTFLGQGGQPTVFSFSPNPATGQVVVGYKQGVGGSGATGDGILFILRFRGKTAGTARVELNRINFRDPAGTRLDVEPATTTIVIR